MAEWSIELTRRAGKSLRALHPQSRSRVRSAIDSLPSGDVKKLRGEVNLFRLRVGDVRVLFRPDYVKRLILILDVFHRQQGYGD